MEQWLDDTTKRDDTTQYDDTNQHDDTKTSNVPNSNDDERKSKLKAKEHRRKIRVDKNGGIYANNRGLYPT